VLSERNRKINLVHEFVNLRSAQADADGAQQHMTNLLAGLE
jgi:hypothetical protein